MRQRSVCLEPFSLPTPSPTEKRGHWAGSCQEMARSRWGYPSEHPRIWPRKRPTKQRANQGTPRPNVKHLSGGRDLAEARLPRRPRRSSSARVWAACGAASSNPKSTGVLRSPGPHLLEVPAAIQSASLELVWSPVVWWWWFPIYPLGIQIQTTGFQKKKAGLLKIDSLVVWDPKNMANQKAPR